MQFGPKGHQSIAEPSTRRFGAAAQAALGRLHAIEGRLIAALAEAAAQLGPVLIAGAADDDPSGIATYSQAGAQFGYAMLWARVTTA